MRSFLEVRCSSSGRLEGGEREIGFATGDVAGACSLPAEGEGAAAGLAAEDCLAGGVAECRAPDDDIGSARGVIPRRAGLVELSRLAEAASR